MRRRLLSLSSLGCALDASSFGGWFFIVERALLSRVGSDDFPVLPLA
jgi:hypothetical protein